MRSAFAVFIISVILTLNPDKISGQGTVIINDDYQKHQRQQENGLRHHSIYLELMGPGILYSINYEYRFSRNLSLRAGASLWSIDSLDLIFLQITDLKYKSFPLMFNYLAGKKASHIELGLGVMPVFVKGDLSVFYFLDADDAGNAKEVVGLATIAYRYQRDEGGLIFRLAVNPIIDASGISPIYGLSLGFGF